MRVTTDDLKKDVEMVLQDLKRNHEISSNLIFFSFLWRVLSAFLLIQVCLSAIDFYLWGGAYRGGVKEAFAIYVIGMLGVLILSSIVMFIICYNPFVIVSCLSEEAKGKSLLLNIAKAKFRYVLCVVILLNIVVGLCFVFNEPGMVAFMGGGWFVTIIIAAQVYNIALAPYFTPAVISGLSKIKEVLSASPR
ncbi:MULTISPECIES: conjugal transfer protein TraS [Enterobacter cloacae complex]|uniref:conjugal transfer protein TraS n=1 Tax=Enterobacter cloacae complex TaxID=354276 RepID=UPI0021C4A9E4|nr:MULTISPECIES: conjugal transfer protein TraS [Enterobacter cloacae complex]CAH8250186.1 Uncharacterised protein [Enterobacter ludwigii]